jgi:Ca2+-binding RTX toxin-like protein
VVKVTANYKAQDMKFWANQDGVAPGTAGAIALDRYIITDQWGNCYIMHASGQADQADVGAAFDAAVLPEGWSKTVIQLDDDLILNPAKGSDGTYHYLVFRDSADNTYHQINWSGQGSLATQLEGMPIWGGQSDDVVSGDGDDDLIHGAGGNDVVSGGAGRDELWGDLGDDTLKGGAGRDKLYGNEGNDLLIGGRGNDVLNGGPGRDILKGGRGRDEFVFASITDSLVGAPDLIIDFKRGRDAINLAAIDADTTADGDQALVYIGRKAFSNTAGELRLDAGGTLIGDVDGNGQADFAIALLHGARLTSGDFIL